jgi:hypothetical protein
MGAAAGRSLPRTRPHLAHDSAVARAGTDLTQLTGVTSRAASLARTVAQGLDRSRQPFRPFLPGQHRTAAPRQPTQATGSLRSEVEDIEAVARDPPLRASDQLIRPVVGPRRMNDLRVPASRPAFLWALYRIFPASVPVWRGRCLLHPSALRGHRRPWNVNQRGGGTTSSVWLSALTILKAAGRASEPWAGIPPALLRSIGVPLATW